MKKILTRKEPEKKLLLSLPKRAGRSSSGRITIRHRGGGAKRLYRIVDWGQTMMDRPARVVALEYDPYRTAYIALLKYPDGSRRYVLAAHGLKRGDEVITSEGAETKIGNRMKLKNIPVGTMVFNVEILPNKGGQIVRSAGASTRIVAQEGKYTQVELPSKEIRKILSECFATVGQVSHPEHRYEKLRKAGQRRLKGIRPTVRGSAMTPKSHPHGGGEGKAPIGLKYPKTPWGKPAIGVKTRRRKHTDKFILKKRK